MTGREPYEGIKDDRYILKALTEKPPKTAVHFKPFEDLRAKNNSLPPGCISIMEECLGANPSKRPGAKAVVSRLQKCLLVFGPGLKQVTDSVTTTPSMGALRATTTTRR